MSHILFFDEFIQLVKSMPLQLKGPGLPGDLGVRALLHAAWGGDFEQEDTQMGSLALASGRAIRTVRVRLHHDILVFLGMVKICP